jgi:hypothetical protein
MPKHDKKSKSTGKNIGMAIADADDDFDNMLAELQALDLTNITTTTATTAQNAGSNVRRSSSSTSRSGLSSNPTTEVTEVMIIQASIRGDVHQLRQWAKQGIRVSSTDPLLEAVKHMTLLQSDAWWWSLVQTSREPVEEASNPLIIAAQIRSLEMMRCLVLELCADVDRADADGNTTLYLAAQQGKVFDAW